MSSYTEIQAAENLVPDPWSKIPGTCFSEGSEAPQAAQHTHPAGAPQNQQKYIQNSGISENPQKND